MKYWQDDRFQKPNKTNVPHLYTYTWIRASCSVAFIFNSILMFFIVKENSVFEQTPVREEVEYIVNAILGLLAYTRAFSSRKCDRTLSNVFIDVILLGLLSIPYVSVNSDIIYLYFFEIVFIVYYAIKIDKNNDIVDNNRLVILWNRKKKERFHKKVERIAERNRNNRIRVRMTEEEKMKRLSRRQRKQIKKQRSGR